MNAEASNHRQQPKRWRVVKSSKPADGFLISSWEWQSALKFFRCLKILWPCLMARGFGRSLSASCFGAEDLHTSPGAAEGCGEVCAVGGILGAKSLSAGTGSRQAAVIAPGDARHVGRAACKICKIACREEGDLLGGRQRLGVLEKLSGGQLPTSASLPWGRALPRDGSCQRDLGFVFSS